MQRVTALIVLFTASGLVAGCGGSGNAATGRVSGRITIDGATPPAGLVVSFTNPITGAAAAGATDASGRFALRTHAGAELPWGEYRIAVALQQAEDPTDADIAAALGTGKAEDFAVPFDPAYLDPSTSGLTFKVESSENTYDADLRAKPAKAMPKGTAQRK